MTLTGAGYLFQFIGGLGLFLYGMELLSDGLQRFAGDGLRSLLKILTGNRLAALLTGIGITAVMQSSSAATVMTVGFVDAGALTLEEAAGVIMGANIGTTVTAWLVSLSEWGHIFRPECIAPLLAGIGAFLQIFAEHGKKKRAGEILLGFGILFIGLSFLSGAVMPYRSSRVFSRLFCVLGENPLLALLGGASATAFIQSSSASVGILQTLAASGLVSWRAAVFITLGQNIGTCVTALIAGAGAGRNARRAAAVHLLFNVIGSIWIGAVMYGVFCLRRDLAASSVSAAQIAAFHTAFNLANTIVLFPFTEDLVRLSDRLLSHKGEKRRFVV